jgi:hypothetical protein
MKCDNEHMSTRRRIGSPPDALKGWAGLDYDIRINSMGLGIREVGWKALRQGIGWAMDIQCLLFHLIP